jgi:hypothetical protein
VRYFVYINVVADVRSVSLHGGSVLVMREVVQVVSCMQLDSSPHVIFICLKKVETH